MYHRILPQPCLWKNWDCHCAVKLFWALETRHVHFGQRHVAQILEEPNRMLDWNSLGWDMFLLLLGVWFRACFAEVFLILDSTSHLDKNSRWLCSPVVRILQKWAFTSARYRVEFLVGADPFHRKRLGSVVLAVEVYPPEICMGWTDGHNSESFENQEYCALCRRKKSIWRVWMSSRNMGSSAMEPGQVAKWAGSILCRIREDVSRLDHFLAVSAMVADHVWEWELLVVRKAYWLSRCWLCVGSALETEGPGNWEEGRKITAAVAGPLTATTFKTINRSVRSSVVALDKSSDIPLVSFGHCWALAEGLYDCVAGL